MENKITKEEIVKRVNSNDANWFYNEVYEKYSWGKNDGKVDIVYEDNWGDGNDYFITLYFKDFNFNVLLEGTYSSWDSPYWNNVSFAKPYTFTEERYRPMTLEEIRDDKINEVLDDNE